MKRAVFQSIKIFCRGVLPDKAYRLVAKFYRRFKPLEKPAWLDGSLGYYSFDEIYRTNYWGNGSGEGSHPDTTTEYRGTLRCVLDDYKIGSVVDYGCGDWQFSKLIDWTGVSYTGYDVVESVINNNKELYESSNIRFAHMLPENLENIVAGDLFIIKDVLQHLPSNEVNRILNTAMRKFKYLMITNCVNVPCLDSKLNMDIKIGDFRPLDVTQPPFNLKAKLLLEYSTKRVYWVESKEII